MDSGDDKGLIDGGIGAGNGFEAPPSDGRACRRSPVYRPAHYGFTAGR